MTMSYPGLEQQLTHFTEAEINLLRRAYSVAFKAHEGQKRKSGEDYIEHPVAVAIILADMHMDPDTIVAGLLHDVIEDSTLTTEDLEKLFGKQVAALVDGVSKLDKIEFKSRLEIQAENFRKMLLAMARDIRVIVIKLADRLHNMRTIASVPRASQLRKGHETIDVYAPIARRLGMHQISDELDDLCLKTLHPARYRVVETNLQKVKDRHASWLNDIKKHIETRLKQHSVDVLWVQVREKQVYSVYKKMREKKCSFNELTDMYGIRVCLGSTDDCYRALGVMHLTYRPFPQRMKDYIAAPKPNGYQSLHTVLMGPGGLPVEVQIRTPVMHQMAEQGISAHWMYKTGSELTAEDMHNQQWIHNLLDMQKNSGNATQFIENLKTDLHEESVYVFTPKGKIIELKQASTALDFAFEISKEVGIHALSARIDHHLSSISTILKNGQTIFVLTSDEPQASFTWLQLATTYRAKTYIKEYLKHKESIQYMQLGEQIILRQISDVNAADIFSNKHFLLDLAQNFEYKHSSQLLIDLAHGNIDPEAVCKYICTQLGKTRENHQIKRLSITGDEGNAIHYALCCMPIPGDEITGVFESDIGLSVHQNKCITLHSLEVDHQSIPMEWAVSTPKEFMTEITLTVYNQRGVLGLIAIAISDAKANIDNINLAESNTEHAKITIKIGITGQRQYIAVTRTLKQLRQVIKIERIL